ncbi:MAG: dTMP kinase [Geobacteraceae bacterium GWC2_53_11]|nr:MAG: dTMP kinase [Geobacteraceae bacterium GWC2_53_11]
MGYFITFEGVEGCGKTTQIKMLSELLSARGIHTHLTREPGGCPIADKIRAILLDAENRALAPLSELMLYAAARAQHVSEVIIPALSSGKVVLCDRFCDATTAYQSFGRCIDRGVIDTLNSHACQGVYPDLTVLFDCDPAIGLDRARRRIEASSGPREERFELEALAFHQRVRAGYLQLAAENPDRFLIMNGAESIDDIFSALSTQILTRIPETQRGIC